MKLLIPKISSTRGWSIGKLTLPAFDDAVLWKEYARDLDTISPYILSISIHDNVFIPIVVSNDIDECITKGKDFITGIGDPTIFFNDRIATIIRKEIEEGRITMIKFEGIVDDLQKEINEEAADKIDAATQTLNTVTTEQEMKDRFDKWREERCHNCAHYLKEYNVCRMVVAPIKQVKACTSYDGIGGKQVEWGTGNQKHSNDEMETRD